jgi:hypothetical protein
MRDMELEPEERSLIAVARQGQSPSEAQRARVRKGLNAKLAAGVAAPLLAASSAMAMVGKVGAGVALLVAVGTTTYVATSSHKTSPAPVRLSSSPAPAPAPVVHPAPEPLPPTAVAPSLVPSDPRPSAGHPRTPSIRRAPAPAAPSDLAGELALLSQISDATKRGDVARAEHLLADYDQRYQAAQLAQERAAAGILLDCAAGRTAAARVQARWFLERWPRSPLVARINKSCIAEANTP